MSRGGSREGAGRKACTPTATHPVRCTDDGWKWLQSQALGKGHTSVGKWADAAGRKSINEREKGGTITREAAMALELLALRNPKRSRKS